MTRRLPGVKIRTLRRESGLTQGELARRAGISASYLNLIESNKRPIAGTLLERIGTALGVEVGQIDGGAERRLVELLEELAVETAVAGAKGPPPDAAEIVARHRGWADLIVRLHRAWRDQSQAVLALADRLNRDPFLGESVHRMLTYVTSIRSAAEILREGEDLPDADQRRFLSIIVSDSLNMSAAANALIGFFDSAQLRIRSATPMEHVDSFIFHTNNHFPELEAVAERFSGAHASAESLVAAAARLAGDAIQVDGDAAPESTRFAMVKAAAARLAGEAIDAIVAGHAELPNGESRELARAALTSYAAGAMLMPYAPFLEQAERHRYDLDILCRRFGVSYEQAAHRVATLRRPGAEGVAFAFMRSDPSGYVTKRLPLPGLPLPRYGTACPLWPLYGAFQTPGVTARCFGELPSGERFLLFARAVDKAPARIGMPRRLLSIMLACEASEADRLVHADGIDQARATLPVGTVCRLCPRGDCGYRQEAPLIDKSESVDKRPMSLS